MVRGASVFKEHLKKITYLEITFVDQEGNIVFVSG